MVLDPIGLVAAAFQYADHCHGASSQLEEATAFVDQGLAPELLTLARAGRREPCRLVAARLGLTEETLRRRLRQEGASYRQLLRRRRCAIAARYLVETNLGILQVAQQAGYGETASFTRAFLAETGMTPSDFRQKHR
jgi:AraC-like DNA-binding protein